MSWKAGLKEQNESLLGKPAALKVIKRIFNGGIQRLIVENMFFTDDERVLKVAAGTCAFREDHRFPCVAQNGTGRGGGHASDSERGEAGIRNVKLIAGSAEVLPFAEDSFGLVMFRLFHHVVNAALVMREMYCVLRTGGRLFLADMAAMQESLRGRADFYKRERDPS